MGQSQTKQVSGELERLLLELRRELVEEEGETAADIVFHGRWTFHSYMYLMINDCLTIS